MLSAHSAKQSGTLRLGRDERLEGCADGSGNSSLHQLPRLLIIARNLLQLRELGDSGNERVRNVGLWAGFTLGLAYPPKAHCVDE